MKHNLGKVIIIYLFLTLSLLFAEDFSYTFKLDRQTSYLKEPVILTLDLNQTNHDIVLLFKFGLRKSDDYDFQRLNAKVTDMHHNTKVHYTYLLHPLKTGDINIHFDLVKRVTSDEAVSYSFSGDRDDFKKLETVDTKVSLPSLTIPVKPLPEHVQFIGDFKLSYKIKTQQAKPFEPIPVQIELEGYGYPPSIDHMIPQSSGFNIFEQKPTVQKTPTQAGMKYKVIYHFALSGKKSFDLPEIVLHALNPDTHEVYALKIPQHHFTIDNLDIETLVDKVDNPEPFSTDWSWLTSLLKYLIVFTAGYLTAISLKVRKKKHLQSTDPLREKIDSCENEKALLQLLMAADSKKFVSVIGKLENGLYRDGKIHLEKLKKQAMEAL